MNAGMKEKAACCKTDPVSSRQKCQAENEQLTETMMPENGPQKTEMTSGKGQWHSHHKHTVGSQLGFSARDF